jgi:hypothetical protein
MEKEIVLVVGATAAFIAIAINLADVIFVGRAWWARR